MQQRRRRGEAYALRNAMQVQGKRILVKRGHTTHAQRCYTIGTQQPLPTAS
jgi:hypothetical protein